jgi:membrane protein
MTDLEGNGRVDRARVLAEQAVQQIGGAPAVQTLLAVLAVFDRAGGGLVAGGLAYSALLALLPLLLLVLSVAAWLVGDPAVQNQIVNAIGEAFPPLEEVARTALEQVSAGAVPTGVLAILGLIWGSSRFYAALDTAMSRIFNAVPRRNPIVQTLRGLFVSGLLVALPVAAIAIGSTVSWLLDLAPGGGAAIEGVVRTGVQLLSPFVALVVFVIVTSVVYRFVPARDVPVSAFGLPAVLTGIVLGGIAQLFAIIAPRLAGIAALFGAFVTVFVILAWLSISLNVLLLGASWTRVRLGDGAQAGPGAEGERT